MLGRNSLPRREGVFALLGLLMLAGNAMAYVGPAPGPEFVGYFLTLLTWMGIMFSSVLLWPIHALLKRWRRPQAAEAGSSTAPLPRAASAADWEQP